MFLEFPAVDSVRYSTGEVEIPACSVGEPLVIWLEAPADGYMTVLHWHEGTGKVSIVFPQSEEDQPRVYKGQKISFTGEAAIPAGRQGFKGIWTRAPLQIHKACLSSEEWLLFRLTQELFEELAPLIEGQFVEAELHYEVIESE